MTTEYEHFYENITMKAVVDTVVKLLMYPFGFHGDTGIRDYLYARLHVHGDKKLDFNDPDQRPDYSTLLLQSEHYTTFKYKNKGNTGKRARFDVALTLPPKSPDSSDRYAENLDAIFAFELGKNKGFEKVIDQEMLNHGVDSHPRTTDISKLFLDLVHYDDLRQGWAIEFYDSRTTNGASIITETLNICKKLELKEGKKLVVVFVGFSPNGKHHISSNDPNVQSSLIKKLAERSIDAGPDLLSYSNKPEPSSHPNQEELFVKGRQIIKYEGKLCHLSCRGYSYSIRYFREGSFVEIDRGKNDKEKYLALKNQIQVLEQAPRVSIENTEKNTDFWAHYFSSYTKGNQ